MSNFLSLAQVNTGLNGTAPTVWSATTDDNLAAITTAGYVADITTADPATPNPVGKLKPFDIMFITYDVDGTEAVQAFVVTATSSGSLVAFSSLGSTLAQFGVYANRSTGAGGSATVTITDANVSAGSIVLAQFQKSANAVTVQKVTAGAGSITVLCSADPGANTMNYIVMPDNVT